MVNFSSESRSAREAAKCSIPLLVLVDPCPLTNPLDLVPKHLLVGAAVGVAVAVLPPLGIAGRIAGGVAAGIGAAAIAKKLLE